MVVQNLFLLCTYHLTCHKTSFHLIPCHNVLYQRLANWLFEGPGSKYFSLWEPCGLCSNYSTLLFQCESNHIDYYISEWAWPCSNKTLFMEAETWISYSFHVLHNILFFYPLKNVKTIFSSWIVQKQVVGRIWPLDCSLPILLVIILKFSSFVSPFWVFFGKIGTASLLSLHMVVFNNCWFGLGSQLMEALLA